MIGYYCNHLDRQLNWQAFTHCTIGRATKLLVVQSVICGMAHMELLFAQCKGCRMATVLVCRIAAYAPCLLTQVVPLVVEQ